MADFIVKFKAKCHVLDKPQKYSIMTYSRPNLYMFDEYFPSSVESIENANGKLLPGQSGHIHLTCIMTEEAAKTICAGTKLELRGGPNIVANGEVEFVESIGT